LNLEVEIAMKGAVRMTAVVAAMFVVTSCGSRLSDATIENAASKVAVPARAFGSSPSAGAAGPADTLAGTPAVAGSAPTTAAIGGAAGGTGPSAPAGSVPAVRSVNPGPAARLTPNAQPQPSTPAAGAQGRVQPESSSGAAGSAAIATDPSLSTVVIGNVGDYSGIVGSVLKEGAPMAQVVGPWLNDNGGLNGHPVKVVTADAAGDPARAHAVVRDLVERQGAIAFMGNIWVLSATGPRAYLEEKGIPVIGGDSAGSVWFQSPMYFPTASSFVTYSLGAVKSAVTAGNKKIALLYCAEVEPCKVWHDVASSRGKEVGGEIVYKAQISLAQPDFTAECLQAQRNGATAMMAGMDSNSISRLARSCLQQGYRPMYLTASLSTTAATAKDPNLDGLIAPVGTFPFPANDLPAIKDYRTAIARYAPTIVESPTTSVVWTSGILLRQISKSLPAKPSSQDFLAGLYQIKNDNLGGLAPPLTYVQGKPAPDSRCYFQLSVRQGRYVAPIGSKPDCV
jgi:branched-chain amino acid transport system substrate-binding protein